MSENVWGFEQCKTQAKGQYYANYPGLPKGSFLCWTNSAAPEVIKYLSTTSSLVGPTVMRTDAGVQARLTASCVQLQNEAWQNAYTDWYSVQDVLRVCNLLVSIPIVSTQNGDSAVIWATVGQQPSTLRELVRAGSDLNLQNNVRYIHSYCGHCTISCPY